jgi:hypothetical protein
LGLPAGAGACVCEETAYRRIHGVVEGAAVPEGLPAFPLGAHPTDAPPQFRHFREPGKPKTENLVAVARQARVLEEQPSGSDVFGEQQSLRAALAAGGHDHRASVLEPVDGAGDTGRGLPAAVEEGPALLPRVVVNPQDRDQGAEIVDDGAVLLREALLGHAHHQAIEAMGVPRTRRQKLESRSTGIGTMSGGTLRAREVRSFGARVIATNATMAEAAAQSESTSRGAETVTGCHPSAPCRQTGERAPRRCASTAFALRFGYTARSRMVQASSR